MQSLKLPSALFGKEFLLHKNPKVFSDTARIYNLFTSVLSTALRLFNVYIFVVVN